MTLWKNYHLACSIEDALNALASAERPVRLVAGGTDLLLDLQQGRHSPVNTLVDITTIPELTIIEPRQDKLFIGAGVPLNRIVASPLVHLNAQALAEACSLIGGPQVRNTATLGGNVAHALPAADGTIALLACQAQAEVADREGFHLLPLEELFIGPGQSTLDPRRELLIGFYLPLAETGYASVFQRVMRPQGVALPVLNMTVSLMRDENRVQRVAIAVGPSGPVPFRARGTESTLTGRDIEPQVLNRACETLLKEVHFRTSRYRATSVYRLHLARRLFYDTITTAWNRAGGG